MCVGGGGERERKGGIGNEGEVIIRRECQLLFNYNRIWGGGGLKHVLL